jgi:hypothetical protein
MTPIRAALAAGAGICVAGFGVMTTLSEFYEVPAGGLGLRDYLSATWGDALLLPITLAGLTYAYKSLPSVPHERFVIVFAASLGLVAGVLTQVQWLLDNDPQLNWTLPAPHTFNGAGVYHAAFLTGVAAVFAGTAGGVVIRWSRTLPGQHSSATRAILISLLSGLGFGCLLLLDNQQTRDRSSSAASLTAVGVAVGVSAIGIAVGMLLRRRRVRRLVRRSSMR